jgi:hypothetical protein
MARFLEDAGHPGAGVMVIDERCGRDLHPIGHLRARPGRAQPATEAGDPAGDSLRQKG